MSVGITSELRRNYAPRGTQQWYIDATAPTLTWYNYWNSTKWIDYTNAYINSDVPQFDLNIQINDPHLDGFDLNVWKTADGNVVDTNGIRSASDTNWWIQDTMHIYGWTDGNYVIDLNIFDT